MFKEPFDVVELKMHADPRGTLNEILRFSDQEIPGGGYIYTFSVNPGARRGDHYHEKKREWLTCVSGKITVLLETSDGAKHTVVLNAEKPAVVYFGPGTAHAILNESSLPAIAVSYGSTQHNPDDPDTFKKVIT